MCGSRMKTAHKARKPKCPVEFGARYSARFELANPDPLIRYGDEDCDKDTSRWKWELSRESNCLS